MDKLIKNVADRYPKMNDYLLRDFREKELARMKEYIASVIGDAIQLLNKKIDIENKKRMTNTSSVITQVEEVTSRFTFEGYRVLSPEERVEYETSLSVVSKGTLNVRTSEWELVAYMIKFNGHIYTIHLYIPYLWNNYLVINNTRYAPQLVISEKVFARRNNGIIAKVIRQPIDFWRKSVATITSLTSDKVYDDFIITTKIFNKKISKSKQEVTVLHYLLCHYGLQGVLNLFKMDKEVFVLEKIDWNKVKEYEYFSIQNKAKDKDPLILQVKNEVFDNPRKKRVVIGILYILQKYRKHTLEDLKDPEGTIFKIYLGKLIYSNTTTDALALNHMDSHFGSLSSYLDSVTKNELHDMGIMVDTFYDLLMYIFCNIDKMLLEHVHSDFSCKKIDILDNLLVGTIVGSLFYQFYKFESRNRKFDERSIGRALSLKPTAIASIHANVTIKSNPTKYNDNWLLSCGAKFAKQSSSKKNKHANIMQLPENWFHPSIACVTSLIAFPSSNPTASGTINPYLNIDDRGSILLNQDFVKDAYDIIEYLPHTHKTK